MCWLIQVNYRDICLNALQGSLWHLFWAWNKVKSTSYEAGPGYLTFKLLSLPCFFCRALISYAFVEKKQSAWQKGNGNLMVISRQKCSAAVTDPASRAISSYATCQELESLPTLEIHRVQKIISMMRKTEGLNKDMWWHLNKNAFASIWYTFFIKMRQLYLISSSYLLFYFCTNQKIQLKIWFLFSLLKLSNWLHN